MKLDYTVQIWREGDQFVAHAMPLDVASSGPTPDAARKAVDAAVNLFLAAATEHGTIKQVLEDAGYRKTGRQWVGPEWLGVEQHSLASV